MTLLQCTPSVPKLVHISRFEKSNMKIAPIFKKLASVNGFLEVVLSPKMRCTPLKIGGYFRDWLTFYPPLLIKHTVSQNHFFSSE